MNRFVYRSLILLVAMTLLLPACSGSDDEDPVAPAPAGDPLKIEDLHAVSATGISLTLGWTSPELADKANIRYDLRYIPLGSEHLEWDRWTVANQPSSDTAPGKERTHEVIRLSSKKVYVFRMIATTDGEVWSEFSNSAVATVAPQHDTTPPAAVKDLFRYRSTTTSLTMAWPPAGDDGEYGRATGYEARYATQPITPNRWARATPVPGPITESDLGDLMETTITGLDPGVEYFVAVVATDEHGNLSDLSNVVPAVTEVSRTILVNVEGTGDYPTIEAAVHAAVAGDLILVGPGRYTWENQGTGDALLGMINVPRDYADFEVRSTAGPENTILDAQGQGKVMSVTGGSSGTAPDFEYAGITINGFTLTGGRAEADGPNPVEGWTGGGLNLHLTDTVVRNCIITGNEATEGGGLWVGGQGDALIEDCLIYGNKAYLGGGVYLVNSEPRITMRRCDIRDNQAAAAGGGIFAANVTMTLEKLLVVDNRSSDKGGGISVSQLNPDCEVVGCTVAGNEGNLGAAFRIHDGSTLRIGTTMVVYNTGGGPFSIVVNSVLEMACSLVYGNDEGNFPAGYTDLGGNLEQSPGVCDRENYYLQFDSVCQPLYHPQGAICDMIGARGVGCGF
jgi:hypothetical protein